MSTIARRSSAGYPKLILPSRQTPQPSRTEHHLDAEQEESRREQPEIQLAIVSGLADPNFVALQRIDLGQDFFQRCRIGRPEIVSAAPLGNPPEHRLIRAREAIRG